MRKISGWQWLIRLVIFFILEINLFQRRFDGIRERDERVRKTFTVKFSDRSPEMLAGSAFRIIWAIAFKPNDAIIEDLAPVNENFIPLRAPNSEVSTVFRLLDSGFANPA